MGEYCVDSGYVVYVIGIGENWSFGGGVVIVGEWVGSLWFFCFVGRYLFYNFVDDNVY